MAKNLVTAIETALANPASAKRLQQLATSARGKDPQSKEMTTLLEALGQSPSELFGVNGGTESSKWMTTLTTLTWTSVACSTTSTTSTTTTTSVA